MHLSPDQMIFWQHGFLKLNGTIVFTWALMLVLAVGSKLVTRKLSTDSKRSRWQNLLEIVVTGIETQIEEVGLPHPEKYIGFLGTLFLFLATASLLHRHSRLSSRRPARSRPPRRSRCACSWPCRSSASRSRGWAATSSPTREPTVIMLPFNIISELSRTLALAVRLFGNMMSGAMIIGILLTITPFIFPIVMTVLGLLTGMVQAYIFTHPGRGLHRRRDARSRAQARASAWNSRRRNTKGHTMDSMSTLHRGGVHRRRRHHHRLRQLWDPRWRKDGRSRRR